jgi:6-phosphofructokinase 1
MAGIVAAIAVNWRPLFAAHDISSRGWMPWLDCDPSSPADDRRGFQMRIGVLTGGGDCPGLNAVIRAIVREGITLHDDELIGFRGGWKGVLENEAIPLDFGSTSGILPRGGTILRTSRTNVFAREDGPQQVRRTFEQAGLDGLIAIGGEDTLGAAHRLHAEHGLPIIGIPKTIDNDLGATDVTFGFDTALHVATEAIDRLHTTAESHNRILVVEVMGRHAGWIALHAGVAGGADVILIPEKPFSLEEVSNRLRRRHARGVLFSIVVVSEGASPDGGIVGSEATDEFGHARLGGIGHWLEEEIERTTGFETRTMVLGHIQRGGTPTAFDRVLATRFGLAAVRAAHDGRWGTMPALHGTAIDLVPIAEAVRELKTVPLEYYEQFGALLG